jgi:hypothetical protein
MNDLENALNNYSVGLYVSEYIDVDIKPTETFYVILGYLIETYYPEIYDKLIHQV